jgi:hypothetical protein
MSSRSRTFSWAAAQRDLRDDRIKVLQTKLDWVYENEWREGGAWVCRNADKQMLGAVYNAGRIILAVAAPDLHSLDAYTVQGEWPVTPVGVRCAKLAVEREIEKFNAIQAAA